MLKTAQFENNKNEKLGVAYFIFDNTLCVFTALDDACSGSSINYAEEMIQAICSTEQADPFSMRFFDLQTRISYGKGLRGLEPGGFEFEEVCIEPSNERINGMHAKRWCLTKCPSQVISKFAEFIDGTPHQDIPRNFEATFYVSPT